MKKDKIVELEHIAELEHSTLFNDILGRKIGFVT